jgi:hypothetical protein
LPHVRSAIIACTFSSKNGVQGAVDLAPYFSFRGVFAPLKDLNYFAQVRVDPELGTITWPNGADLDPDVLYGRLTGEERARHLRPVSPRER